MASLCLRLKDSSTIDPEREPCREPRRHDPVSTNVASESTLSILPCTGCRGVTSGRQLKDPHSPAYRCAFSWGLEERRLGLVDWLEGGLDGPLELPGREPEPEDEPGLPEEKLGRSDESGLPDDPGLPDEPRLPAEVGLSKDRESDLKGLLGPSSFGTTCSLNFPSFVLEGRRVKSMRVACESCLWFLFAKNSLKSGPALEVFLVVL